MMWCNRVLQKTPKIPSKSLFCATNFEVLHDSRCKTSQSPNRRILQKLLKSRTSSYNCVRSALPCDVKRQAAPQPLSCFEIISRKSSEKCEKHLDYSFVYLRFLAHGCSYNVLIFARLNHNGWCKRSIFSFDKVSNLRGNDLLVDRIQRFE